jgi:DNA-binding CsgD family transcriptional regulator
MSVNPDAIVEDHLAHYGILRKSGRYPWGSGADAPESTRNREFLDAVKKLKNDGLSDKEIARGFGMTTTQLRNQRTISLNQQRQEKIGQAERLREKGYSNTAIGQRMGINESSVRALLAPGAKDRTNVLTSTVDMLKREVEDKKYVDIGHGVEAALPLGVDTAAPIGISKEKLKAAVAVLQDQGYKVHYLKTPQAGTGFHTSRIVLSKPDVPYSEVYANRGNIKLISEHSPNRGRDYEQLRPPISVSSRRIEVKYAEDGGSKADGVIYIRPGAKDLSLGESHYAQVRIAVDGTHYLKGMAVYKDDLPPGTDIVFNTNKSDTGRKKDAFKEFDKDIHGKINELNPFGAEIKPGGQRGALNIINEEGDWDTWSRNLSSQVLSKQSPALAKTQLKMTYERRQIELTQLKALTNPAVRKKLLETFADETDSSAVHLKAAALPSQATKVILPLTSINPNQIYAPSFANGRRVVLIRFPHAGTFEIPELTVNNRNREARKLLGSSTVDAVGIHHKVAERLSGADFDGDFVLAIPNDRKSIKTTNALEGLKGFDPIHSFPHYDGMPVVTTRRKNLEMGKVTNLIADMSLRGAGAEEMARAVRHSMVVIDSEKHNLDFRASEKAHGIPQLKRKYQDSARSGASTLITRATAEKRVPQRRLRKASRGGPVDPVTGRLVYEPTGASYVNKRGEPKDLTTKTTRLGDTDDAFSLIPKTRDPHPMEVVYAEHSNRLKAMANDARKEALHIRPTKMNKSAKTAYAPEVASLDAQLNIAKRNAPLERQAQALADTIVSQKRQSRPDLDPSEIKKMKYQALEEARIRTGAHKTRIRPTDKEWAAIQAGAVSNHKLKQILDNSDLTRIRELATPRSVKLMTSSKTTRAKAMLASGYTQEEVARHLGVSLTTLKTSL